MENITFEYLEKEKISINENNIKGTLIKYKVTKDVIDLLINLSQESTIRYFMAYKDNNKSLIIDNIPNGRILEGGLINTDYYLFQYIITEGLAEFIQYLNLKNKKT